MGTITKRISKNGNTTFQAKCRRTGFPTQSKTFHDLKDAKAYVRKIERAFDTGELPRESPAGGNGFRTLADVLRRYQNDVSASNRGGHLEVQRIDIWLHQPFAKTLIPELKPSIFAAWRDARLKEVKPGTVLREMNLLYAAIHRARKDHGVDIPECRITRPKAPAPRDRRLHAGEFEQLIKGCEESRNKQLNPAIILAIETACRAGELIAMEWRHVDFKRRVARLPITKNGYPRIVPLSTTAIAVLESLPRDGERVLSKLTGDTLKHGFARLCKRVEIEGLHFHDLRREAITRMIERGLSIAEVQACSGHRTLSQLAVYSKPSPELIAAKLG